jgi:glutaminyl-peptide cyclotransferase
VRGLSKSARIGALLAVALAIACERGAAPSAAHPSDFDGERAFRDLEALVQIGPRPAGTPAAGEARRVIRERLRQAGWRVEAHDFEVTRPRGGRVSMTNLIARRSDSPARVLLITHYDTKNMAAFPFLGANDGASGAAVLLELARAMASDSPDEELALVFCDGEEAFGASITPDDGLYGSKALAERMAGDGSLAKLSAVVLVDMVGDKDLNLALDIGSSPELRSAFEAAAKKLGLPPPFDPEQALGVIDDHSPFQERGVKEVLALIDFQYGARTSPGPRWHTAQDTLEAVSADSLNRVGKPLVETLRSLAAARRASP